MAWYLVKYGDGFNFIFFFTLSKQLLRRTEEKIQWG